jgi:hypothetical protein
MDGTVFQQFIDMLKSTAPLVWETLVRQVYVYAVADFAWGIGLAVGCFLLAKLGIYGKKISDSESYSSWEVGYIFSFMGSVAAGITAFGLIISGVMALINPNYYAIQLILSNLH